MSAESRLARELTAVAPVVAALTYAMYAFGTQRAGLRSDDAGEYLQMAESPATLTRLPYTFRLLTPLLAAAWPGGVLDGFTIVTVTSLALACTALYGYQRVIGLSAASALCGAGLFAVSGGAIRMLTTPTYLDAFTYLTEAAAFLFLSTAMFWPFITAVVLGVLNRETAFLLIPLYFFATPAEWRTRRRDCVAVGLPLAAFLVAAVVKLWFGGAFEGASLEALAPHARTFRQDALKLTDLFDLYSTFGVLWILALKNAPGPTEFQRRALIFAALVLLQLVVARGDEGRNLSHLFVIVVPLAMLELERLLSTKRHTVAGLFVVACAASMVHARWGFIEPTALRYGLVATGTIVVLGIVTAIRPRLQGPNPGVAPS